MDAPNGIQPPRVKEFDRKEQIRAEKREHLRGRNNVTSCRSPTRDFDSRSMKNELKEKRHLEFLRRRSVSLELCGMKQRKPSPETFATSSGTSEKTHINSQGLSSSNGRPAMILTPQSSRSDHPGTSKRTSLGTEQVMMVGEETGHAKEGRTSSTQMTFTAQLMHIKSFLQTDNLLHKKPLRDANVQTEYGWGFVAIRESDVQRLANYLQEALWREEALRKKLGALQESTANLMNSSEEIWTARCSEDLLRNKIEALEAQLELCLQKLPKDVVKKVVLQMEEQKLAYEEKALVALQRATQEKTEAIGRAEALQQELTTAKAELLRWQSLYEELTLSSGQLREQQHLSDQELQRLHRQTELFNTREAELREDTAALRQEKEELQYSISLLEEDNQVLREEIQQLRDDSSDTPGFQSPQEAEPRGTARRDSLVQETLRRTEEKLRLKEKECAELQTELHTVEQECQSSQIRLSQCRDELRLLSYHQRKPTPGVSWWRVFVILLLVTVSGVVSLCLWHPPFREQVEDLYSDIETRIEDYLMQMASPPHSGCFRPV